MKKSMLLFPLTAGIFGVAAGVIRGVSLNTAYEIGTKLHMEGDIAGMAVMILSIVFFVLALAMLGRYQGGKEIAFEDAFRCDDGWYKMFSVFCGMLLAAGGVLGLYLSFLHNEVIIYAFARQSPLAAVPGKIAWVFMVISGIALVVFAGRQMRQDFSKQHGFWILLPVFWMCLELVAEYNENAAIPVISTFAYGILCRIALMVAFYMIARLVFIKPGAKGFLFAGMLAVYFVLLDGSSYFINALGAQNVFELTPVTAVKHILLIVAALFLAANMAVVAGNDKQSRKTSAEPANQ